MSQLPRLVFVSVCLGMGLITAPIQAGLIIDPTLGSNALLTPAVYAAQAPINAVDDITFTGNLGFAPNTFRYFGQALNSIKIGTNGNLSADPGPTETFFPNSFATQQTGLRIAALWDDLIFVNPALYPANPSLYGVDPPINQIYETVVPNSYYAVTWHNARLFLDVTPQSFPSSVMSVQAILFAAETTLRGFTFQPNDIAFGYTSKTGTTGDFGNLEAEIGLNSASNQYVLLPGARNANGMFTTAQAQTAIPWEPNVAVLFRPQTDGLGNFVTYQVSEIQLSAVPEPVELLWLAALLPLWRRRRAAAKGTGGCSPVRHDPPGVA